MHRVLVALALIACHNDSISHPDIPPLPPASGTPVGYIVDSAADLKLTDAQVASLKDIDSNLSGQLDIIDMRLKAAGSKPTNAGSGSAARQQQPGGFQMSGRRGGRRRNQQMGSGAGSGSGAPKSAAVVQLENERENDVRDAISRALNLLDATQRKAAVAIFNDRGLDLLLPSSDASASDGSGDDEGSSSGEQ
jgi:hypothetical protein